MTHLLAALAQAGGTPTRVVVLRGEAGIGKSRLLSEFQARCDHRGVRMLLGRAERMEKALPYSAIANALVPISADAGLIGDHASQILEALAAGDGDPDDRLRRVFRTTLRLLDSLGEQGVFVLALDDLHVADDDTVALVLALTRRAQRLPMVLVLSLRDPSATAAPALEELIRRLEGNARSTRIDLAALEEHDVARVVEAFAGRHPSPNLMTELDARAAGNPFLLIEILRAGTDAGFDVDLNGKLVATGRLPTTHPDAILGRFLPLSVPARRLARVISLLTDMRLVHLPAIACVAGLSASVADAEFDCLLHAGILRRGDSGTYGFAHELIRETLENELGPAERRSAHAQIASLLEGTSGVDLAEVAHHAAAAADGATDIHAAEMAIAVGDRMVSAPASAATWYARAVSLSPEGCAVAGKARGRRAQALARSGLLTEASDEGRRALELLEAGADRALTLAALVQALIANGDAEQALAILDREIAANGPSTRLRVWRASALALLERWSDAQDEVDLARSEPLIRAADRLLVLVGEAQIAHGLGDIDREPMLITAIEELADTASPSARIFAWRFCGYLAASSRSTSRARELLDRARRLRTEHPGLGGGALIDAAEAVTAWADGRWDEALALIEVVRPELEMSGEWIQVAHLAVAELRIRVARGEFQKATAVSFPARLLPPPYAAMWSEAQATLAANTGAVEAGLALLDRHLAVLAEGTTVQLALTASGARLAARGGDIVDAARRLDRAHAMSARCRAPFVLLQVAVSRAEALGDAAAAREAIATADLLGCPFEKGRGLLALGRLDHAPLEPLSAAWHIFRRLGAEPWRQAAAAALRERGLPVPRLRRKDAEALTDAERQVAELVRFGMRNREIAERLSYSHRTVESYLTRIYRKVGVDSRLGLARALDDGRVS